MPRSRRKRLIVVTVLLCVFGFLLAMLIPDTPYREFARGDFLIFHMVVEIMSIIVSFAVFTVGWHAYWQNRNKQDLLIGVLFLVVGLIDFLHTLSYQGMPAFLSENTVTKASTYWISARLVFSFGLLGAAFVSSGSARVLLKPYTLLVSGLALVAALAFVVTRLPGVIPPMYIEGVGQSPLKFFLEWVVIAVCVAAIYAFGSKSKGGPHTVLLQMALVVSIFSELGFALYRSAFDSLNGLGHVYKVGATYLIFRALFVSSLQRPYYLLMAARDEVERSFASIGDALGSRLHLNQTLNLIGNLASDILGCKHAAVMLMRDGELRIAASRGMKDEARDTAGRHTSAAMAVATQKPVTIPDVSSIEGHDPECHCQQLEGSPARSVASAPIVSGDDTLGVIEVYSPDADAFGPREAGLLSSFARQAAVAIRNSIAYERERAVAQTFQKSLLPAAPSISGLDIAVCYVPADDAARVGGDLYDVFNLNDDCLAIVIGDVCGHGLSAVSTMAMTSYLIKGFLTGGMSPGEALKHVNVSLCRSTEEDALAEFVTVFLCVLDISGRKLQYSNAGHHMPVILRDGACGLLELHSALPLGIYESVEYETHLVDLGEASGLLMYTDGVVEARKQSEFFGDEKLCSICCEMADHTAHDLLEGIIGQARSWSGMLKDDIAALAIKW